MRYFFQDPNAPKPTHPRRVGVCALIERGDSVLLDCRRDDGRWGLIGGWVEDDESLGAGLHREVLEETGLTVRAHRLFGTFSDPSRIIQYPDGSIQEILTLTYWVEVESLAALRVSDESRTLQFVPRSDLHAWDIVETHRHIIARYLEAGSRERVFLE